MSKRTLQVLNSVLSAGAQRLLSASDAQGAAQSINTLAEIRGPIVKILQSLAMFPDLLPKDMQNMGEIVCSNVPPMGERFVQGMLQRCWGSDLSKSFSSFDLRASAAASLGQVHQASAIDGKKYAVKLQYPQVESWVMHDLKLLRLFLSYRYGQAFDVNQIIEDIRVKILEEMDYVQEAQKMDKFALYAESYPKISIPCVYHQLTSKKALVMDWVEGESLADYRKSSTQDERSSMGESLFSFWMETCFHRGEMHGDPHFGNYIFSQGRVTLLDFGNTLTLPQGFREGMKLLFYALDHSDMDKGFQALELVGFWAPTRLAWTALYEWVSFVFQPLLKRGVCPIYYKEDLHNGSKVFKKVMETLKQEKGVKIPQEFVWFDRVIMSLGAVMYALNVECSWRAIFEKSTQFD